MSNERQRHQIPVPDDDGYAPFEVWKDGKHFRGFASLDEAMALYMSGKAQGGTFEVRSKGDRIWPKNSFPINDG